VGTRLTNRFERSTLPAISGRSPMSDGMNRRTAQPCAASVARHLRPPHRIPTSSAFLCPRKKELPLRRWTFARSRGPSGKLSAPQKPGAILEKSKPSASVMRGAAPRVESEAHRLHRQRTNFMSNQVPPKRIPSPPVTRPSAPQTPARKVVDENFSGGSRQRENSTHGAASRGVGSTPPPPPQKNSDR
jgi:hypothetical protein